MHLKQDQQLLSSITNNAFDFLKTAIKEFKKKPKYSILHFNTAIELFLKARLIHEHWSLIVVNEDIDKSKFVNGDFQSITITKSIKKIRTIIGDEIPTECETAFNVISKHRNKLIHFFHKDLGNKPLRDTHTIAREQCFAWYHLKNLIKKWDKTFPNNQARVQYLDELMKQHHTYLQVIFTQIEHGISNEKKKGIIFKNCPSCNFESSKEQTITDNIKEYKCLVCPYSDQIIIVECPKCENQIEIEQGDNEPHACLQCEFQLTNEDIAEILDTEIKNHDDYHGPISCSHCCSVNHVVNHCDLYICTSCYTISDTADTCEWCNQTQIPGEKLEDSFASGCEFCDGRFGHMKDD
jgi:hypothetical protein